jgi:hypothetical protein
LIPLTIFDQTNWVTAACPKHAKPNVKLKCFNPFTLKYIIDIKSLKQNERLFVNKRFETLLLLRLWAGFKLTTLVVTGTDGIGSCTSNYYTTTATTTVPRWIRSPLKKIIYFYILQWELSLVLLVVIIVIVTVVLVILIRKRSNRKRYGRYALLINFNKL